jgi:hypothetical protein
VTARPYWLPWLLFGALVGAGLPFDGIAFVIGIVALAPLAVLAILHVPGFWIGVVGAGVGFSVAYSSLLLDPNTPDEALRPLVVGLAIAAIGVAMSRTRRHRQRIAGH